MFDIHTVLGVYNLVVRWPVIVVVVVVVVLTHLFASCCTGSGSGQTPILFICRLVLLTMYTW